MGAVNWALNFPVREMHNPEFEFKFSRLAAKHNWEILQKCEGNLGRALQAQRNALLGCGSEFRKIQALRPLLQKTPLWDRSLSILSSGVDFLLEDLDPQSKQQDLIKGLELETTKGSRTTKSFSSQ